jgi:hypothetical protein
MTSFVGSICPSKSLRVIVNSSDLPVVALIYHVLEAQPLTFTLCVCSRIEDAVLRAIATSRPELTDLEIRVVSNGVNVITG